MKGKSNTNKENLSVDTGNVLRGLFAVVIVFHHLSQQTQTGFLFHSFKFAGYLASAVFFFLSGYGLQKSYLKSEKYKNGFLTKRLPKVLIPYIGATLLYWIFYAAGGKVYSLRDIFAAILSGDPLVLYSWYIVCICYFYIAFWLIMHACKKKYPLMVLCAVIWFLIYAIVCTRLGYGTWWFSTPHLLMIGMLWAIYEQKIFPVITRYYYRIGAVLTVVFAVTFIGVYRVSSESLFLTLTMISSVLFVLIILLLTLKTQMQNPVLKFLGKISAEIYLIHGLIMLGFRSEKIYVQNGFLWSLLVVSCSILSGWILHKFFSVLTKPPVSVTKL